MSAEVKPGYKQTEVGVIPEDWSVSQLSNMASIVTGNTPSTSDPRNYGDEYLFVGPGDLGGEKYISNASKSLSKQGWGLVRKLPTSSILFTCIGIIGKSGIAAKPLATNQQINALITNPEHSSEFLYYALGAIASRIRNSASEQVVPLISKTEFGKELVAHPCKVDQGKIALTLSDFDILISSLDKLIAKKRDIQQTTMQQLLTGQRRLPGFSGEWETWRVRDLGEVVTGNTPRTDVKSYWSGSFPWITPTDISAGRDMFGSERQITLDGLKSTRRLPANTVLVTCIASIGKNAILRVEGSCNQQINAVIPNHYNSPEFLYYIFESSKSYLLSNAGTTATSIISKSTFSELTFRIPTIKEQVAIAAILSDMGTELAALETRIGKVRQLKQGMMQELLTGRIRLV